MLCWLLFGILSVAGLFLPSPCITTSLASHALFQTFRWQHGYDLQVPPKGSPEMPAAGYYQFEAMQRCLGGHMEKSVSERAMRLKYAGPADEYGMGGGHGTDAYGMGGRGHGTDGYGMGAGNGMEAYGMGGHSSGVLHPTGTSPVDSQHAHLSC